jgi:hypothetical protein
VLRCAALARSSAWYVPYPHLLDEPYEPLRALQNRGTTSDVLEIPRTATWAAMRPLQTTKQPRCIDTIAHGTATRIDIHTNWTDN